MTTGTGLGILRLGASIPVPISDARSHRPWAVGYVSTPGPVRAGAWTHWHAAVEACAMRQGLPMLHVYSDENTDSSGDAYSAAMPGLARMVDAIREVAHLRWGYVGVVIVPALEHLSPARNGCESIVANLLSLHFGVTVQTAIAPTADADPWT